MRLEEKFEKFGEFEEKCSDDFERNGLEYLRSDSPGVH